LEYSQQIQLLNSHVQQGFSLFMKVPPAHKTRDWFFPAHTAIYPSSDAMSHTK